MSTSDDWYPVNGKSLRGSGHRHYVLARGSLPTPEVRQPGFLGLEMAALGAALANGCRDAEAAERHASSIEGVVPERLARAIPYLPWIADQMRSCGWVIQAVMPKLDAKGEPVPAPMPFDPRDTSRINRYRVVAAVAGSCAESHEGTILELAERVESLRLRHGSVCLEEVLRLPRAPGGGAFPVNGVLRRFLCAVAAGEAPAVSEITRNPYRIGEIGDSWEAGRGAVPQGPFGGP